MLLRRRRDRLVLVRLPLEPQQLPHQVLLPPAREELGDVGRGEVGAAADVGHVHDDGRRDVRVAPAGAGVQGHPAEEVGAAAESSVSGLGGSSGCGEAAA